VALVERDRRALVCLRENAEKVRRSVGPSGGELRIVPADVAAVPWGLSDWAGSVDLIFADPPYHPTAHAYGAVALLRDPEFATWAGRALLVLEHAADSALPWHPEGPWRVGTRKRYGSLAVTFARQA
jgi:16S rRNA G966 N2-methylase RsmD